jgi:hypothetical protein
MTERSKHQAMVAFLTSLMIFASAMAVIYVLMHACGPTKSGGKPDPAPPPPPDATCDGTQLGSLRKTACPDGQTGDVTEACQAKPDGTVGTWNPQFDTCVATVPPTPPSPPTPPGPDKKPCDQVVTFDELAPIIALNCASCHVGRDTYAQAKAESAAMNERIALPITDPKHMPAVRPSLSVDNQALFTGWSRDGFLAAGDCIGSAPPAPTFRDLAWAEAIMDADVHRQPINDQPNTRYLLAVNEVNLGRTAKVALAKAAGSKATNSVSTERGLFPLVDVAPGIWRINIDALGIQQPEWEAIENASQLNLESFTGVGLALKLAMRTRMGYMNVDDFNDSVLRNAAVYYRVTEAAATLPLELQKLGVDFAGDLATFRAALIGFNGSTLAPAANRLISRHDSTDGAFYATYDTGPIVSNAQNVYANPLLKEAGGQAYLKFAAGEQIFALPNGLHGYFLADAAGKRLDFADPNIVHDFTSNPVAPIIRNAISCFQCHAGGFIPATDQVRASLGISGLAAADAQIAGALFRPQAKNVQVFDSDNARYHAALVQIGVDPTQPDPISQVSDGLLGDQHLDEIGYRLWLRPNEMAACINQSPGGKLGAGQLLAGGTLSHDQLIQVIADLKRDCRLMQDPLN